MPDSWGLTPSQEQFVAAITLNLFGYQSAVPNSVQKVYISSAAAMAAWVRVEGGGWGPNNWLNSGDLRNHPERQTTPQVAAQWTANIIMGRAGLPIYYWADISKAITAINSKGANATAQDYYNLFTAIQHAKWCSSGGGECPGYANNLKSIFESIRDIRAPDAISSTLNLPGGLQGDIGEAKPGFNTSGALGDIAGAVANGVKTGIQDIIGMDFQQAIVRVLEIIGGAIVMAAGMITFLMTLAPPIQQGAKQTAGSFAKLFALAKLGAL